MEKSLSPCNAEIHCTRARNHTAAGLAAALLLVCTGARGGVSTAGESGAWLRIPAGAQAGALGGAYAAAPASLQAWWNPARLPMADRGRMSAGVGVRSLGRSEAQVSGALRVPPRAGLGLAFLYRGDPSIDNLRDANENLLGTGGFTTLNFRAGAGYLLTRTLSLGASIGFFHQRLSTLDGGSDRLGSSSVTGIGGFDLSLHLRPAPWLALVAQVRKLGLTMKWEIQTGEYDLNTTSSDAVLPELVAAARVQTAFLERPLYWTVDVVGFLFDPSGGVLGRPQAMLHNGLEWEYWENFALRAGLGEIPLSGRFLDGEGLRSAGFSPRICAGFGAGLERIRPGLALHYAIMSDRVWAGIDQVLDITLEF